MYLIFYYFVMREQHESDSEDVEEDVMEDVARQYFIYSILVHVAPRLELCM